MGSGLSRLFKIIIRPIGKAAAMPNTALKKRRLVIVFLCGLWGFSCLMFYLHVPINSEKSSFNKKEPIGATSEVNTYIKQLDQIKFFIAVFILDTLQHVASIVSQ